jgi:hypothetical protein
VTNRDLAGEYADDGSQVVVGAVTSSKIADGSIQARDLGRGAVTTSKQSPNAVTATGEPVDLSPGGPTTQSLAAASLTLDGNHVVLLTGQAQATCAGCALSVTVVYGVFDGDVPVTGQYTVRVSDLSPEAVLPVSDLVTGSGPHTYTLRAEVTGGPPEATVNISNASLTAVDLGVR